VFQQSCCLLLYQLRHHVAQHGSHSIKSLICCADIVQAMVIKKDLLYNENGNCLAKLRTSLHDTQTQRDDFCRQEEVYNVRGVILDQCTNDTEGGQSQIFEWSGLGSGVKEWVQEEWDMGYNRLVEATRIERRIYHSRRVLWSHCAMQRIVRAQVRCRRDWMPQP